MHRPVVPVLSRGQGRPFTANSAVMVHLAFRPAVLRLLFPFVHVVRVLLPAGLLRFGVFFLLHPLVLRAPVLEPNFDLRTDNEHGRSVSVNCTGQLLHFKRVWNCITLQYLD